MIDDTRSVIDQLYSAYLAGDGEAMLDLFDDDIHVRFLGQCDIRGIAEARRFFEFSAGHLEDLDFRIQRILVDGEWAAVTWAETAVTLDGAPWENHGVDVFRVERGAITELHENNDVRLVHRHLPRWGDQAPNAR